MKNWGLYILFRNLQIQDWFKVLFRVPNNCSLLGIFYSYSCLYQCSEEVHRSSWMTHWERKVQEKEEAEVSHQCPTTRTALATIINSSREGMRKRCLHFHYKLWPTRIELCQQVRVGIWQQNVQIFFKAFFCLLLKMKLIRHRQALKQPKHSIKELTSMLILSQQIR